MPNTYRSVFSPRLFAGQAAIVTGAGSGIGRCNAHELASLGAKLALIGRKPEKLSAVRDEIARAGGEARCYVCD
ncbi:MAG TPA: SDR family NAD(P)-dependent oxidoreductase, partial [Burkholderiales bacterium]|nr:SDR family NAD(P)-dependent oxidoreductase [Burkholderiales bacterium]